MANRLRPVQLHTGDVGSFGSWGCVILGCAYVSCTNASMKFVVSEYDFPDFLARFPARFCIAEKSVRFAVSGDPDIEVARVSF